MFSICLKSFISIQLASSLLIVKFLNTLYYQGYNHYELVKVGDNMKKILIADDAMFMRNALKVMLEKNGFEVVAMVDNGRDAVTLSNELKPDIVTLDITMPKLNGIEALKEIKAHNPDITVVMLTAVSGDMAIRECIESGANNFVVKPFREEKLLDILLKG